jgi:hypothetical protein
VRRGSCRGLITSQDATRAPPPATIGMSRCQQRGQSGPRSLPSCLPTPPVSSSVQTGAVGEEREGRGVGGAAEAHGLPSCHLRPTAATTSVRSPFRYSSHAAPPPPITCTPAAPMLHHPSQQLPRANVTTLSDMLVAVMNISPTPWNSPPPKRREEGGSYRGRPASQVATRALPPTCRLHHPRPRAPPLAPRTPRSQLLPERSNEGV